MSPTVLRVGGYRFFFYSNESHEPPHIHVRSAEKEAKYWLQPISLVYNYGFSARELRDIEHHIQFNLLMILDAWNEFFGGSRSDDTD